MWPSPYQTQGNPLLQSGLYGEFPLYVDLFQPRPVHMLTFCALEHDFVDELNGVVASWNSSTDPLG